MPFDIASMDTFTHAEHGTAMPLLHLGTGRPLTDDDGKPLTITLLGKQSRAYRESTQAMLKRRAEARERNIEFDLEFLEAERVETLVACTRDWFIGLRDGKPFPCTPANIRTFWEDPRFRPYRDAAWGWMEQDRNFLPPAAWPNSHATPDTSSSSVAHSLKAVEPLPTPSRAIA